MLHIKILFYIYMSTYNNDKSEQSGCGDGSNNVESKDDTFSLITGSDIISFSMRPMATMTPPTPSSEDTRLPVATMTPPTPSSEDTRLPVATMTPATPSSEDSNTLLVIGVVAAFVLISTVIVIIIVLVIVFLVKKHKSIRPIEEHFYDYVAAAQPPVLPERIQLKANKAYGPVETDTSGPQISAHKIIMKENEVYGVETGTLGPQEPPLLLAERMDLEEKYVYEDVADTSTVQIEENVAYTAKSGE